MNAPHADLRSSRKRKVDDLHQQSQPIQELHSFDNHQNQCGICLSCIETPGALGCAHSFCFDCITHWSQITNRCPLCRRRFSSIATIEKRIENGAEMEVAREVVVEERDFSPAPTEADYYGAIDPLDEESAESESEDDSSADYEDGEADSDDEWILNTPQPRPTPPAPVDEVEELRKRWARASVRRRFRCEHEHCERAFKTGSDLKRHMLIHAQVRQFGCEHCEKRFTRRQDLKRHLVTHLAASAPRSASSMVGDDHRQVVETSIAVVASSPAPPPPVIVDEATGQRRFVCTHPGCDKTFTLNQNLKRHRKVVHKDTTTTAPSSSSSSEEERRQAATISSSTAITPSSSGVVVVDEATGHQRFACTYPGCGQTYSHRPNLTRHRKSAHKDTTASASSSSSSSSSGDDECPRPPPHPATSTGVIVQDEATGRFVCDFVGCGKTFTLRNNLARHRRTHQGGASYQCPECDKSYTQSGDLKRHLSVHSGERPFACHLCGQAFRQKAHLAAHLRSKAHASSLSLL